MCCPPGYEPDNQIQEFARSSASRMHTAYALDHDPSRAVQGTDIIYTDVWASMGREGEADARADKFRAYQVNSELMAKAGEKALVSHCLPAHRGEEITSEVLDSERSIAWDEAENRLHMQKAILYKLMKKQPKAQNRE
jgi:ornithine carbamoyltransferase